MKSVVFTFGRMNPPTTGHQLLVNKLLAHARQTKATPRVYLSHSVGKKDPLPYDKKISFARAAFGAIVRKSNSKNVIQILKDLEKEGFTHVTMFGGSDRVPEFTNLLNRYNGKEYNFEKIEVKSAGERDPDADDVSGMSASKMRALAKDEKVAEFLRGAPNTLKITQAKNMYNAVRKALLGEDVMDYSHDERFVGFIVEASDDEMDIAIPSDGEIAKHIDDMSVDDFDLDDADALMLDVILGQDIDEKEEVDEARVLSLQTRQKLAQRMKSMSKRLARLRDIKRKQMPAQQRLRMRARKAALMILRRRATGKTNLDYSTLSRSQRVAVDNALVNRFGKGLNSAVDRISKRILPMIRKKAQTSVAQARDTKESFVYEAKDKEGSAKDVAQDKIQAAKRGMSVADWEKTKADAAHDSPLNINPQKLDTLSIDPTQNDRVAPNPKQGHLHLNRKLSHYARSVDEGRKSSADKDARDAGDTNIIYQMRKTINSRGEHETTFADGHKAHVSIADAKKMLAKFEALRLPADKHEFTIQAGRSLASFKNVMAHGAKPEKKKISLGGKKFNEFYLGVGRSRTVSAYDNDEPPGNRRIAEVAKDEDRPEDPNKSRPLSQKLDLLLRLGLADTDELQKYRRALRSSKKAALQSPEMRAKLADLLDKLIDLTTQDPATYSRVRYRVMTKEALALLNKAERSGIDVSILAEVFVRGLQEDNDSAKAFNRVNSFIAGGKAAEIDNDLSEKVDLPHKYRAGLSDKTASARKAHWDKMDKLSDRDPRAYEPAPGDATAKTKPSKHTLKYKRMYGEEAMDEAAEAGLAAKAKKSGVSIDTLRKVYRRGVAAWNSGHRPGTTPQQWGMARVNSYITKGKGTYHGADKDLREDDLSEKSQGLWANIHAKRQRIKSGSGERMRKPGEKGAPTADQIRSAKGEAVSPAQQAAIAISMKKAGKTPKNEDVSPAAKKILGDKAKEHGGKVPFKSTTYKDGKKVVTHGYNDASGKRVVTHTTNEAAKSDAQQRAAGAALATQRGEYAGGKKGGAINRMALMKKKELIKLATKKKETNEGLRSTSKGNEKGRNYDPNKLYHQTGYRLKDYRRPGETSKAQDKQTLDKMFSRFTASGGKVKVLPPGKKTPKTMIRPRDYMKPNQAAKVGVTEQNMTTHDAVPLAKRVKKVKSFHAWHPKSVNEAQRTADVKVVKVRNPDGTTTFRKERTTTTVQQEASHPHPTGKIPYVSKTNKEMQDDLRKKFKDASEGYTGSEPTSSNPNDPSNRFVGTDAIRRNYAAATPGQEQAAGQIGVAAFSPEKPSYGSPVARTRTEVDHSKDDASKKHFNEIRKALSGIREQNELNESFAAGFELAPFARDYGIQVQSAFEHHPEVQEALDAQEDAMNEAIYQGRNVPLNKPMKGDVKKSKVYVRDPSTGNIKKVNFGDKKLSIKKDQPGRKRSYCARSSGQGNLTKKTSANYWSRRAWDC